LCGLIFLDLFLDLLLNTGRHTNPPPKRSMAAGSGDVPAIANAKNTTLNRPDTLFIILSPWKLVYP
jgi:hypothetical protein